MPPRLPIAIFLLAFCLLGAGLARAELSQLGNVRISFDGDISPRSLPRDRPAPVTVNVEGAIATTDGTHPPPVRQIQIALNRNGRLSAVGLPACSGPQLQATSTATALTRCRPSLVGHGRFGAEVQFASEQPVAATGAMLAFFGRSAGRPALLLHLYLTQPVQTTLVLPLVIARKAQGRYGTFLSARIPTLAGGLGSVTRIDLTIGRSYRYRGQSRSFISASCPAPAGFTLGNFTLARGTFYFDGGKKIDTTLARNCYVRRAGA